MTTKTQVLDQSSMAYVFGLLEAIGDINTDEFMYMFSLREIETGNYKEHAFKNRTSKKYIYVKEV